VCGALPVLLVMLAGSAFGGCGDRPTPAGEPIDYRQFTLDVSNDCYEVLILMYKPCHLTFQQDAGLKLIDARGKVTLRLDDASEKELDVYWALWTSGGKKTVDLHPGVRRRLQSVSLVGTAVSDDKTRAIDVIWRLGGQ